MSHSSHAFIAAYAMLLKDDQVLLARRYNTGFGDGKYSLPAGHVEPGETCTQTLIREAQEEAGVTLKKEAVHVTHVMHRNNQLDREYIDIFYQTESWIGTPKNMEPKKCDDLSWFPLNNLPKNILPYVRQAIECSLNGIGYSEFGWKE